MEPQLRGNGRNPKGTVVAAARRVNLYNTDDIRKALSHHKNWQRLVWDYTEAVGEAAHAAQLKADALSKLRLYPAEKPTDSTAEPAATEDPAAVEALDRLRDPSGSHASILHDLGLQLTVPGVCYLVGIRPVPGAPPDDIRATERWWIASFEEVADKHGTITVAHPDSGQDVVLRKTTDTEEGDFFARIWRPSGRKHADATSPFRSVMDALEELLIAGRYFRSVARSRISRSAIVVIPNDLTLPNPNPEDPTEDSDPLVEAMMSAFLNPITDEESAAAVAPFILRGDIQPAVGSGIEIHEIPRTTDELMLKWQEQAQKRFAQGVNLPVELVFGLGQANHWGAGQIEESDFRQYLEPDAILVVNSLTEAYFRPALADAGLDPSKYLVWFDADDLVRDREKDEHALEFHGAYLISDDAARRAGRWSEDDAPDEAEIERRIQQDLARRGTQPSPVDIDVPEPVVAAGNLADLGGLAAQIDQQLTIKLQTYLDGILRRALEKAGNKLLRKASANKTVAAAVKGTSAEKVAATLGPSIVAQLGADEVQVLTESVDSAESRLLLIVAAAQKQTLNLIPNLNDRASVEAEQTQDRTDAWTWLREALIALAVIRLYNPDPVAPDPSGEWDEDSLVPSGTVREAISRAGGNYRSIPPPNIGPLATSLGVATGVVSLRLFASAGATVEGWRWDYGMAPRKSFPPHLALNGVEFTTHNDPRLTNGGGFPAVDFYRPGDHAGCLCGLTPLLVVEISGRRLEAVS